MVTCAPLHVAESRCRQKQKEQRPGSPRDASWNFLQKILRRGTVGVIDKCVVARLVVHEAAVAPFVPETEERWSADAAHFACGPATADLFFDLFLSSIGRKVGDRRRCVIRSSVGSRGLSSVTRKLAPTITLTELNRLLRGCGSIVESMSRTLDFEGIVVVNYNRVRGFCKLRAAHTTESVILRTGIATPLATHKLGTPQLSTV